MIPEYRLIFWAGFILLPFITVAMVLPHLLYFSVAVIVFLAVLAMADAASGYKRLSGIRIEVPNVTRLSRGREGKMELRIHQSAPVIEILRVGIQFPDAFLSPDAVVSVKLSSLTRISSIQWRCTGFKQGQYVIGVCYIEARTKLGFWSGRAAVPIHAEIRVYPDLFSERQTLSALFQRKGIGVHPLRQVGKGKDFEQLREYLPGDNYEDIYWKSTAKRGFPVTKVFQIERTQTVYAVIDASRLSSRASENPQKRIGADPASCAPTVILDRFLTAALTLGLAAESQGDLFGVLAFSDKVRRFVKAGAGKMHYSACRDALYTLQPTTASPDYSEVFTYIGTHIRRRTLMIFLTSLDDPVLAESFIRNLPIIRRRHLMIVGMIKPERANPLFSSPDVSSADDLYECLGNHYLWSGLSETDALMKKQGVSFVLLENEKLCADLISRYVAVKKRQIL